MHQSSFLFAGKRAYLHRRSDIWILKNSNICPLLATDTFAAAVHTQLHVYVNTELALCPNNNELHIYEGCDSKDFSAWRKTHVLTEVL
jgi:hypothetical protein